MWLFTREKIIYVDLLHEYRKIQVWEYNLFDTVWITETFNHASKRCPYNRYYESNIEPEEPKEGVIIWEYIESIYSYIWKYTMPDEWAVVVWQVKVDFEKWQQDLENFHAGNTLLIFRAKWYKVIFKNGEIGYAYSVKKNHGELQETFEYMEEVEKKKLIVEQTQHAYEKHLREMGELLTKGKEIQKKHFSNFNP